MHYETYEIVILLRAMFRRLDPKLETNGNKLCKHEEKTKRDAVISLLAGNPWVYTVYKVSQKSRVVAEGMQKNRKNMKQKYDY
jgi:hypothetical protein